eukprot:6209744-Pleurochrysis_carterae.AAC.2
MWDVLGQRSTISMLYFARLDVKPSSGRVAGSAWDHPDAHLCSGQQVGENTAQQSARVHVSCRGSTTVRARARRSSPVPRVRPLVGEAVWSQPCKTETMLI